MPNINESSRWRMGPVAVGAIVPMGLVATGAVGAIGSAADSGKRLDARPEPLAFGKEEDQQPVHLQ